MFSPEISAVVTNDKEGSSNSFPIVFEQVLQVDFDRLLSLIITGRVDPNVSQSIFRSIEEWIPVLDLANRWQMPSVRRLAVDKLKSLSAPHIKIDLGKKFEEISLVKSGLIDICSRETPITEPEVTELGMEIILKCVVIREKIWKKTSERSLNRNRSYTIPYSTPNLYVETATQHAAEYVEGAFPSDALCYMD